MKNFFKLNEEEYIRVSEIEHILTKDEFQPCITIKMRSGDIHQIFYQTEADRVRLVQNLKRILDV